jgi:uncharacterized protein (TIGR04141 family)
MIMRKRQQASSVTGFDTFGVNRLRDVLSKASGIPADVNAWGKSVTGADSFSLERELAFRELGDLCLQIDAAFALDDYKEQFDWIDYIQPVTDPDLLSQLRELLVERLRSQELVDIDLAPPEILDWEHVSRFQYSFERGHNPTSGGVVRFDLRLDDWIVGLRSRNLLADLTHTRLGSQRIFAIERWWRVSALVG